MPPVPERYPYALSDAELEAALVEMMDPASWPGFDDFGRLLPELKLALLRAGLEERSRREAATSASQALRVAYAALGVAFATLIGSIAIAFLA